MIVDELSTKQKEKGLLKYWLRNMEKAQSRYKDMKDLYSRKKDLYFEADLLVEFKDGRANFSLEFPKNSNSKTKK